MFVETSKGDAGRTPGGAGRVTAWAVDGAGGAAMRRRSTGRAANHLVWESGWSSLSEAWTYRIAAFCQYGIVWAAAGLAAAPIALELDGLLCDLACHEPAGQVAILAVDLLGLAGLAAMCLGIHAAVFYRRNRGLVERSLQGVMPEAPWMEETARASFMGPYRRSLTRASTVFGLAIFIALFQTPLTEVGAAVLAGSWTLAAVLASWPLWQRIWRIGTPS